MDRNERVAAVQAKAGDFRLRKERASAAGPSCQFCIYGPENGAAKGICRHIVFQDPIFDPVTGDWSQRSVMSTMTARSPEGLCGPEGLLFERYSALNIFWRAIRPHLPF
jgi:hypothetical protein